MAVSNYIPSSRVMQPGVCTSSTRPASPYTGMTIYETDTALMRLWNGTAWRTIAYTTPASGSVLQVVSAQTTTLATSASSTAIDTNLSATITPTSTTSKVLVLVTQSTYVFTPPISMSMYLVRASTTLQSWIDFSYSSSTTNLVEQFATHYLDSPASTSALTYKTQFNRGTGSGTVYCQVNGNQSTITLMEIAG